MAAATDAPAAPPPPAGEEARPAAQPPPGGLTGDEAELVERLRAKYGGGAPPAPAAGAAEPPAVGAAPTAAAAAPSCRVCAACLGKGVLVEMYEHRRLVRCCAECSGEGVVGGGAARRAPPGPAAPRGAAPTKQRTHGGGATAADRLAACEQELAETKASLAGCSDADELRLHGELVMQLELWRARLRSSSPADTAGGSGAAAVPPATAACT